MIEIFERERDETFIDSLAVAVEADLQLLAPDRIGERIAIFEECAAAGLREIQKLMDKPSNSLEELLRLTQDARIVVGEELPGLDPDALAQLENF